MNIAEEIEAGPNQYEPDDDMPELSSITLKKKLYNTRLQNAPEDLQTIISGATKDINDVTKLLLSFHKYRAEQMT